MINKPMSLGAYADQHEGTGYLITQYAREIYYSADQADLLLDQYCMTEEAVEAKVQQGLDDYGEELNYN